MFDKMPSYRQLMRTCPVSILRLRNAEPIRLWTQHRLEVKVNDIGVLPGYLGLAEPDLGTNTITPIKVHEWLPDLFKVLVHYHRPDCVTSRRSRMRLNLYAAGPSSPF